MGHRTSGGRECAAAAIVVLVVIERSEDHAALHCPPSPPAPWATVK